MADEDGFDPHQAAFFLIGVTVNRLAMIDQCADQMAVRIYWHTSAQDWFSKKLTWPLPEKLAFLREAAVTVAELRPVASELIDACDGADRLHLERHSIIHGMASGITETTITFTRTKIVQNRLHLGSVDLSLADLANFTETVRALMDRFHKLEAAVSKLWPGEIHGNA